MKILLADDDDARAAAVDGALTADASLQLMRSAPGEQLAAAVARHQPDIVLIDMARPDRDALDAVRALQASAMRPVVLFVDEDDPGFMEAAINAGVCSYNVGGIQPVAIRPILRTAVALFRAHQATRARLYEAEAKLADQLTITRAKAVLMAKNRMAEGEAHRWLQRRAMASGRRLADVASAVLAERGGA